ncbi:MAG: hypothetical protein HY712_04220 [candidate division NC10 bacterium]|nr:hypothetical protein [candidate division NC10 bacterium]
MKWSLDLEGFVIKPLPIEREVRFHSLEEAREYIREPHDTEGLWEQIADGRAVITLPDGTRWGRVHPAGVLGLGNPFFSVDRETGEWNPALTPSIGEWLLSLCEQHNNERDPSRVQIHDVFLNLATFNPGRAFCFACGWVDLTHTKL